MGVGDSFPCGLANISSQPVLCLWSQPDGWYATLLWPGCGTNADLDIDGVKQADGTLPIFFAGLKAVGTSDSSTWWQLHGAMAQYSVSDGVIGTSSRNLLWIGGGPGWVSRLKDDTLDGQGGVTILNDFPPNFPVTSLP